VLLTLTFAAALVALGCGLWRAVFGRERKKAITWTLVALLPALVWGTLGGYAAQSHSTRDHPHNVPFRLVAHLAAALMELQTKCLYPHHLETERIVMFYDDRVSNPKNDIEEMDRHVARLEKLTGKPLRAKVYWVRGRLLGQGGFCNRGIISGSWESPAGSMDRHELAHAVLSQHESSDTDPPTLLSEGWAVSQEWADDRPFLAQMALAARDGKPVNQSFQEWTRSRSCLKDLTDAEWYHHASGPVYAVGGGFVDFVIRQFGVEKFLELYFSCRAGRFEDDCHRVLGTNLDALEQRFWADMENWARQPRGILLR
jgi:hypothetical protein